MLNTHPQSLTISCHRGSVLQQLATMWDPLKFAIHIPYPQYPGCRTVSITSSRSIKRENYMFCRFQFLTIISSFPLRAWIWISIVHQPCVSAALFDSRKICLHQQLSSFFGRKIPPKYHRTNWSITLRTCELCSLPLTSQSPFIQLTTILLSPRISRQRWLSDGQATFQGWLSSRGLFLMDCKGISTPLQDQMCTSSSTCYAKQTQNPWSWRATPSMFCIFSASESNRHRKSE